MKPFLLYEQYDNNIQKKISNEEELIENLNLNIIFNTMAQNDTFLYDTVKNIILNSLTDINTIMYRQKILEDCLENKSIIKKFYNLAATTLKEVAYYREYTKPNYARVISTSVKVMNSVGLLEIHVAKLKELMSIISLTKKTIRSKGLITFCDQLSNFMTDEFFEKVKIHIADFKLISEGSKMIIGSSIGNGMKGIHHVLRNISKDSSKLTFNKIFFKTSKYVIRLDNTSMANSAREIEDAGLIHILRLINDFNDNIIKFFEALQFEIGFYFGCTNLHSTLLELNAGNISFPIPDEIHKRTLIFEGLYDLSLSISEKQSLVSNDIYTDDKNLFIITGANQGGKSTYLRSIGISQLLRL